MDGDLGPYDALGERLARADTVLILDFSLSRCAWRALRRSRERADFWWWLLTWRRRYRPATHVHVLCTPPRQLRQLLRQRSHHDVTRETTTILAASKHCRSPDRRFAVRIVEEQGDGVAEQRGEVAVSGYVYAAHEGDVYDWRGARVVIKASGEDTLGQLGVMESTYPPGLSVPAHFHQGEDEMLYLLDGQLQGFCDDDQWTAIPGAFVFIPRDRPHGFVVTSNQPARALVITGPSQLDRQVAATGTPVPGPSVGPRAKG